MHEYEANTGNFPTRGQTNMTKLRLNLTKFLTLRSSGGLTYFRDHYFKQQKEDLLVITGKNSDPNQILMGRVLGERVCLSVFLMPSLLNTVGKIICYDFTKKCMESRVSKVFLKKVHLVKIRGQGCAVVQFYPWFKFFFFSNSVSYITIHQNKTK